MVRNFYIDGWDLGTLLLNMSQFVTDSTNRMWQK